MKTEDVRVFVGVHETLTTLMFCIRVEKNKGNFPKERFNLLEKPVMFITKSVPKKETPEESHKALLTKVRSTLKELGLNGYKIGDSLVEVPLMMNLRERGVWDNDTYLHDEAETLLEKLDNALYYRLRDKKRATAQEDSETEALLRAANWMEAYQFANHAKDNVWWRGGMSVNFYLEYSKYESALDKKTLKELKKLATFNGDFEDFKLKGSALDNDLFLFSFSNFYPLKKR